MLVLTVLEVVYWEGLAGAMVMTAKALETNARERHGRQLELVRRLVEVSNMCNVAFEIAR